MKKITISIIAIIAIILFFLLIVIITNNKSSRPDQFPEPTPEPEPTPNVDPTTSTKPEKMGFVAIPAQPVNTDAWLSLWPLLGENSDIVLHHVNLMEEDWNVYSQNGEERTQNIESLDFISLSAEKENLERFFVIDPLAREREEIGNLPSSVGANFGDEKVREAVINLAVKVAEDYKPEYLGVFSEVNSYTESNPNDKDNVKTLYEEVVTEVKKVSPGTKVTSTFQYEALQGLITEDDWETFDEFEDIGDLVAITTYPSPFFDSPSEIPEDYYLELSLHTDKPIIIAESGWPTGGARNFHGSEKNQADFVSRITELTKDLDIEVWIWWFIHDWDGEGYPDFFKTMGLRSSTGAEKPAWEIWQEIYNTN